MLRNRSIGAKISIFMAAIILAVYSITALISYSQSSSKLTGTIKTDFQNTATLNAKLLSQQLEIYKSQLSDLAGSPEILSLSIPGITKTMDTYRETNNYENITYISKDGTAVGSDGATSQYSGDINFNTAVKGNIVVADPVLQADQSVIITIYCPVKNVNGSIFGVIAATIDGSFLNNFVSEVKSGKTVETYVLNSSGTAIADTNFKKVRSHANYINQSSTNRSLKQVAAMQQKMASGLSGVQLVSYDGYTHLAAFTPVPDTNWSLCVDGSVNELMGQVNMLRNQSIISAVVFILCCFVILPLLISWLVSMPLKRTARLLDELSRGHLGGRLNVKSHDEVGRMALAMNKLADTLQNNVILNMKKISHGDMSANIEVTDQKDEIAPALSETISTVKSITGETHKLIQAAEKGDLTLRCDADRYGGSWGELMREINALMDCVANPINEVRSVIKHVSVYDFTQKVNGGYNGLFSDLAEDTNVLCEKLDTLQGALAAISKGDTSHLQEFEDMGRQSDNDSLTPTVIVMMRTLRDLISETRYLIDESVNGHVLTARGDPEKFHGGYREIIEGFNNTLDAMSEPMADFMDTLNAMAVNDYTTEIRSDYTGDYKTFAETLTSVKQQMLAVQLLAEKIARGDISELEKYREVGKRSENDRLIPAFTQMMESIQRLINEITGIAESAADGNLSVRGNADQYDGEYVNIINTVNRLLDEVERPTKAITGVMLAIMDGNYGVTVEGVYSGQFSVMVNAVNNFAATLQALIREITFLLTEISKGNLNTEYAPAYKGDAHAISVAVNRIIDSLNEIIGGIRSTSEQVAAGAGQMSEGALNLSQGTAEQANVIEQLTASSAKIAAQTKQSAENAETAKTLVETVKTSAVTGKSLMKEMLESISKISESAGNISKIIKVIDDLAFQTNILALNAAVEAARAGVYGKGFAVVAEEVRSLAVRSADAAKETSELIEDTLQRVTGGSTAAAKTSHSFDNIADGVSNVADLISEIADASNKQAADISQIDRGLEQVSSVVQTNSATAEQDAASSEQLANQAENMRKIVSKFQLKD